MLYENIEKLVEYGKITRLLEENDAIFARNQILELFGEKNFEEIPANLRQTKLEDLETILQNLLAEAIKRKIINDNITEKDLFDSKLMNCLMPRPSEVQKKFWALYKESPQKATDFYYNFSQNSDYIRRYRVSKDKKWKINSEYGEIDITINLSKPEKDPKAIAAAKNTVSTTYPKCLLCSTNEGYAGNLTHPGRSNHRIIPIKINNSNWGFQYSPYVYYNEHCIVFNLEHLPMKMEKATFVKLFDFVKQFPHYCLGSNADLPIVGGSILSHDHYQGGRYNFAMQNAKIEKEFTIPNFSDVKTGILKWPLSVIRLQGKDEKRLIELANYILEKWKNYSDNKAGSFAFTNGENHNTITPIARMQNEEFQLDLALRNNLTSEKYPLGIFHPHPEFHNIKKENIGLIEVMGLAILPARLEKEMAKIAEMLKNGIDIASDELTAKHAEWLKSFEKNYGNFTKLNKCQIEEILQNEIGKTFVKVLENAGVYKNTPEGKTAFLKFVNSL